MASDPVQEVRAAFVRLWGRLGPFWGVPPTTARVYAFLLATADPADGETIALELELSRGAVSMACRELADWGLIHPERAQGERRIGYRVESDAERVVLGIVQTRKRREWDPLLQSVRAWRAALRGERTREAAILRDRLTEVEGLVALVDDLAESFLRGGALPRLGLKALAAAARRKSKQQI
jgi:DNA-binding transcriptional regulator GbsR (MarR family)